MENEKITFLLYGISLIVEAPRETALQLRLDFSYFSVPDIHSVPVGPLIRVAVHDGAPPSGCIPPLTASMYLPDGVVYDDGAVRYVDYQGKALTRYDYATESGDVYSSDVSLLHEITYLLIHSRAGELMDRRGLHRVHALGMSIEGKGILCLLPQGGGKTTLFLACMNDPAVKLLSDDIPLVNTDGMLLPFPQRVGVAAGKVPSSIPSDWVMLFPRRQHGSKALIDSSLFAGRISGAVPPWLIFVGKRVNAAVADIQPLSLWQTAGALVSQCVVGLGLPQVVEYFLRGDPRDGIRKCAIVLSRIRAVLNLLLKSRHYVIHLGTDPDRNSACLLSFIDQCRQNGNHDRE